ncbi:hypothetical protein BH10PSE19_BH10PSE19_08110 [soil metagenome]
MLKKNLYVAFLLLVYLNCSAVTISCPSSLPTGNNKKQLSDWVINKQLSKKSLTNNKQFPLESAEILNGRTGDENSTYPAWLAPDNEQKQQRELIQNWNLSNKQNHYLLICRYHNSDIYLTKILSTKITVCAKTLVLTPSKTLRIISLRCY